MPLTTIDIGMGRKCLVGWYLQQSENLAVLDCSFLVAEPRTVHAWFNVEPFDGGAQKRRITNSVDQH